jgi:hypothetical protein
MAIDRFKPRMTLPVVAVVLLVTLNAVLVFLVFSKDNSPEPPLGQQAGAGLTQGQGKSQPSETKTDSQPSVSDAGSTGPVKRMIHLVAASSTAKRYHALRLHGRYKGVQRPVSLRVQERIKHTWVTYPLPAMTNSSGRFTTFVSLARFGLARVRVIDPRTGLAAPAVSVRVTS